MRPTVPRFRPAATSTELARVLLRSLARPQAPTHHVQAFEASFAGYHGVRHAVATSSVRLALFHVLQALHLPAGAECLCTPLTVFPVLDAIVHAGLRPVLVDLEPDRLGMDPGAAAAALTPDTRVLLVTHLWGVPAKIPPLADLARRHGLVLLEDTSQCLGGEIEGRRTGTFGRAGFFSLGTTKPVTALAGAVTVTDDPEIQDALRRSTTDLPPPPRGSLGREAATVLAVRALTSEPLRRLGGSGLLAAVQASPWKRRLDGSAIPTAGPSGRTLQQVRTSFGEHQAWLAGRTLDRLEDRLRHQKTAEEVLRGILTHAPGLHLPGGDPSWRRGGWNLAAFHPSAPELRRRLLRDHRVDCAASTVDAVHEIAERPDLHRDLPVASRLARTYVELPLHPELAPPDLVTLAQTVLRACADLGPHGGTP